jgi:hypothetical protein
LATPRAARAELGNALLPFGFGGARSTALYTRPYVPGVSFVPGKMKLRVSLTGRDEAQNLVSLEHTAVSTTKQMELTCGARGPAWRGKRAWGQPLHLVAARRPSWIRGWKCDCKKREVDGGG